MGKEAAEAATKTTDKAVSNELIPDVVAENTEVVPAATEAVTIATGTAPITTTAYKATATMIEAIPTVTKTIPTTTTQVVDPAAVDDEEVMAGEGYTTEYSDDEEDYEDRYD